MLGATKNQKTVQGVAPAGGQNPQAGIVVNGIIVQTTKTKRVTNTDTNKPEGQAVSPDVRREKDLILFFLSIIGGHSLNQCF